MVTVCFGDDLSRYGFGDDHPFSPDRIHAFTPRVHTHAARRLSRLADELCDGRFIAMGGGGYNRRNLAAGCNEVVRPMLTA